MTRFEERGVERQYSSKSVREAKKAFEYSCDKCSTTGKHILCDCCAISCAHMLVLGCLQKGK